MKKNTLYIKTLLVVGLVLVSNSISAQNEQSILANTNSFIGITTHTDLHPVAVAHYYSILHITGIPTGCQNGIFYNFSTNKDSHALLLSAYVSGQQMSVGYDVVQNVTPWEG